ncbi:MAG: hypothetical protein QNL99_15625 [SAR86 cluster bacterium]
MTILAIGIDNQTLEKAQPDLDAVLRRLAQNHEGLDPTNIIHASNVPEAIDIIARPDELSAILVDSRASTQLLHDITLLLGYTPITTDVVILLRATDTIDRETLAALGVITVDALKPN